MNPISLSVWAQSGLVSQKVLVEMVFEHRKDRMPMQGALISAGANRNGDVFQSVVLRSCGSCGRNTGDDSAECDDLEKEGLPDRVWNCWRPKGTILVWQEKPA